MNEIIDSPPLASFPVLRSRDAENIRETMQRVFGARRFDSSCCAESMEVRANHWQSRNISLSYWSNYGASIHVGFPIGSFFRQFLCLRGSAEISVGQLPMQVTSEKSCVVMPETPHEGDCAPGFQQLILRIKTDAVLAKLTALIGATPSQKLVFDRTKLANDSAIANLRRLLMFFASELDSTAAAMPSLALTELEQALIVSFLCSNQHNYSAFLEGRTPSGVPWQVRRAEEYIEAHWDQPITIEDIARVTSSSARNVFIISNVAAGSRQWRS